MHQTFISPLTLLNVTELWQCVEYFIPFLMFIVAALLGAHSLLRKLEKPFDNAFSDSAYNAPLDLEPTWAAIGWAQSVDHGHWASYIVERSSY